MASINSSMRLKFLKESADSLKLQSPSTSAYLMSLHNQAIQDGLNSLTPSQHQHCCSACGSIRISGQTIKNKEDSLETQAPSVPSIKPRRSAKEGTVYKCLRCHRRTVAALPRPLKRQHLQQGYSTTSIKKSSSAQPGSQSKDEVVSKTQRASPSNPEAGTTSGNTSSKKRAKARKQQGLQALLAAGKQVSQPQTSSSASLDLFDFLLQ